jgi:hypothetical protein
MINSITINNVDGTHSYQINTDVAPLHDFDVTVTERVNMSRQKAQANGVWPTLSFRDAMEIHVEGDIFGTSSSDYFTKRASLIAACYGDPNAALVLTNRKRGDLDIDFVGSTEHWKCPFTITAFSAPVQGLSPSRTPFLITFSSTQPYFTGVTSGNFYYYA